MDAEDAQCNDEGDMPTYKLIAFDPDTGLINYEHPNLDLIGVLDGVQGWHERKPGEPWSRPHDPFEAARDPREEGI